MSQKPEIDTLILTELSEVIMARRAVSQFDPKAQQLLGRLASIMERFSMEYRPLLAEPFVGEESSLIKSALYRIVATRPRYADFDHLAQQAQAAHILGLSEEVNGLSALNEGVVFAGPQKSLAEIRTLQPKQDYTPTSYHLDLSRLYEHTAAPPIAA